MLAVLGWAAGCGSVVSVELPGENTEPVDTTRYSLVARFAHISDAQIVDEESPARLVVFAALTRSAYRPYEAYSTQLLDGTIRAINQLHVNAGPVDFVIHTGDATDNNQLNELRWFVQTFDGGLINPRTGPDDRDPSSKPEPLLDPHEPFLAQGLYRQGVHGPLRDIAWYSVVGNHDHFATGVFPIVSDWFGHRTSPLPPQDRIGLFMPVRLDPIGAVAWAPITPAHAGPPAVLNFPMLIEPNPERRYATERDWVAMHWESATSPRGHGFSNDDPPRTWYSAAPVPGLRLITLNSSTPFIEQPTLTYQEGAISLEQLVFLRAELEGSQRRGEAVIVATHHPASNLRAVYGTSLVESTMSQLLNDFSCVKLHLAGHAHANRVLDRGGYLEILTGSTLDAPQQGRIVEVWQADMDIQLRYSLFSHLDEGASPDGEHGHLFEDPLRPMRAIAAELAQRP